MQNFLKTKASPLDHHIYKLVLLVSIIEQIKRYNLPEVNEWLKMEELENILRLTEIADRIWTNENPEIQQKFQDVLDIYILVYVKALSLIEKKRGVTKQA